MTRARARTRMRAHTRAHAPPANLGVEVCDVFGREKVSGSGWLASHTSIFGDLCDVFGAARAARGRRERKQRRSVVYYSAPVGIGGFRKFQPHHRPERVPLCATMVSLCHRALIPRPSGPGEATSCGRRAAGGEVTVPNRERGARRARFITHRANTETSVMVCGSA